MPALEGTDTEQQVFNMVGKPYNVILFNDESHSMDEVVNQIRKATGYEMEKAMQIMLAAHASGRAVVITTGKERAEHVSVVLEEIRLGTKIEEA